MSEFIKQKTLLIKELTNTISHKVLVIDNEILGLIGSRDSDTKSSVGDKHETSRAKIQTEIDQLSQQLFNANKQKNDLSAIDVAKNYNSADVGSLIETNNGNYFISIGWGRIQIENENYFVISLGSPIGRMLQNQKKGDRFKFRNIDYSILKIS